MTVYRSPQALSGQFNNTTSGFWPFGNGSLSAIIAAEANAQVKIYASGWAQKLRVYISANSASTSTTIVLRKNGADTAVTITIAAGATGWFEDTTNTVSLSSGDLLCFSIARGGAGTLTMFNMGCDWLVASATGKHMVHSAAGESVTTASVTRYAKPSGIFTLSDTTLTASSRCVIPAACTVKNLGLYVSSNARTTTTTVKVQKNGADTAIVISIGSGATGWFEDTSNTESFAAGDTINYVYVNGTGSGACLIRNISCESVNTTTGSLCKIETLDGSGINTNQTIYFVGSGGRAGGSQTTEANAEFVLRGSGTIRNFYSECATNTAANSSVWTARKNNSDQSLTATVPATTAGTVSDTSNSFTWSDGDKFCFKIVRAGGSSGSYSSGSLSHEMLINSEADPSGGGGIIINPLVGPFGMSMGGYIG